MECWIEVGLPDERRLRKACGQAEQVVLYAYGARGADLWWSKAAPELERCRNLSVIALSPATTAALAALAGPRMTLNAMVQEGDAWLAGGDERVAIERTWWMRPGDERR